MDANNQDDEIKTDDGRGRRPRKEDLELNQYEQMIAMDVVAPEDIAVMFDGKVHSFLYSKRELIDVNPQILVALAILSRSSKNLSSIL